MTAKDLQDLISTVGFPIVMCGGLFWYMIKQEDRSDQRDKANRDLLNEIKVVITQLTERLEKR